MKSFIKDIIIALLVVGALALVIKPTIVKESSMEPTLYENNYLLINKMAYKFKDHPDPGDIIVFNSDLENEETGKKKLLIKRVIGVEGDVITIEGGNVYRNGQLLNEDYLYMPGSTIEDASMEIDGFEIPYDRVFVMGDHREVSMDSRSPSVGTVSELDIMGKAFVRLYPFDEIRLL
ncbi:MAG: signal peptidase I [Lentihominibacter sp.]|jgi:signal peptidase I